MKYFDLLAINKLFFSYNDIAQKLGITPQAARVSAARYVKQGLLLRLKRDMYMLKDTWKDLDIKQKFKIANYIQTPSYISLLTALEYYDITTQMQQNFVESIALKRTKEIIIEETVFNFKRIDKKLYFGFLKLKDVFIAEPEKAFLDGIYLTSIGRYRLDMASIDFNKLEREKVLTLLKQFPQPVIKLLNAYEYL
jgi:predicted transcriptional regulator of viral defense system